MSAQNGRRWFAGAVATVVALGLTVVSSTPASATTPAPASAPLTNLAHLDFLTTTVRPPTQAGHTTYRLTTQPALGVLWVYATRNPDGSYTRVGGGTYSATTNTYGQGAYDADDIARAAVVYLRHFVQFGDRHSRDEAIALLRGLTYLQTASGPDAGNVVLWMQPDGTLTPSATPADVPDPSDSANSYWLARTLWALGEGYADLRHTDPAFAAFLQDRLQLGVAALRRDSLTHYGHYLVVDGARTPAWLIVDEADASAEAVLGLAAYVHVAPKPGSARVALRELSVGIAEQGTSARGSGRTWPYGAILPSATSQSSWHAWAALTPAALAASASVLHRADLLAPAVADAAAFSPDLLVSYGPISGLNPAPTDRSSIAYGADSRVESLLAVAQATHSRGLRQLAGEYAGWFFGQNPAGRAMYDPASGVTFDGVSADGVVNQNSGAESTIHGLLAMLALDRHPAVARIARAADSVVARDGTTVVEGESAAVQGAARATPADPPSSAESTWSGGAYLQVSGTATARWTVPAATQPRVLEAVLDRVPGRAGSATYVADGRSVGRVGFGGGGAQGASAVPGELVPVVVGVVPPGATSVQARFSGGRADLDALLLTPLVSTLRAGSTEVLTSRSVRWERRPVTATGPVVVENYDRRGRSIGRSLRPAGRSWALLAPGGFSVVLPAKA